MAFVQRSSLLFLAFFAVLLGSSVASLPTYEDYVVYSLLEDQLLSGDNSSFDLYRLTEVFYPKVGHPPICVPITYTLTCSNAIVIENCTSDPIPCDEDSGGYNASYLWSQYNLNSAVGPVLLSYAWSGIRLKGFTWEDWCDTEATGLEFVLNITNILCRSSEAIKSGLKDLTAVAKSYAKYHARGRLVVGDSDTKGYAMEWTHQSRNHYIATTTGYTVIIVIVLFDLFIFLTASAMTTFTYETVYEGILHKRNPYYPLFWSCVVLSLVWNVGPSWLVLSAKSDIVFYSIAAMVPLEFLVALLTKKKSDFPVPLFQPDGCSKHVGYFPIYERTIIKDCLYCLGSHIIQTLAIWTILVFITFLGFYVAAVIIAFYLHPTQVLVKVLFIKAVAVSAVLNVALLFSNGRFKKKCNSEGVKHNLRHLVKLCAIAAFLPIQAFLAFMIGGIIFTEPAENNSGLKRIITLLPSLLLVFGAWFTKGKLFPPGTADEADLGSEIVNELETGGGGGSGNRKGGGRLGGAGRGGGGGGSEQSSPLAPSKAYSLTGAAATSRKSYRSTSNTTQSLSPAVATVARGGGGGGGGSERGRGGGGGGEKAPLLQ